MQRNGAPEDALKTTGSGADVTESSGCGLVALVDPWAGSGSFPCGDAGCRWLGSRQPEVAAAILR